MVADEGLQILERHLRRVGRSPERVRWDQDEAIHPQTTVRGDDVGVEPSARRHADLELGRVATGIGEGQPDALDLLRGSIGIEEKPVPPLGITKGGPAAAGPLCA
jgi:hypothetical protein